MNMNLLTCSLIFFSVYCVANSYAWTCPDSDKDVPEYHAHPVHCWQFYECSDGIAWLFNCPYGTYWDQNVETCVGDTSPCGDLSTDRPTTTTTATTPKPN